MSTALFGLLIMAAVYVGLAFCPGFIPDDTTKSLKNSFYSWSFNL